MLKNRQYFRTHGIPLNSASNFLSYDIVRFKIEVGVDAKFMCKNIPLNTRASSVAAQRQPIATTAILDDRVNMLGLCDPSNLLFVLSAEERRAIFKLL